MIWRNTNGETPQNDNNSTMRFPNRIRELREASGLSLRKLAERADDADAPTLSKMERGQKDLSLTWLRRIAAALGTTPCALLPDQDIAWRVDDAAAELLTLWRKLRPTQAANLLAIAQVLAKEEPAELLEKNVPSHHRAGHPAARLGALTQALAAPNNKDA